MSISKSKAFLIHLGISFVIFLVLAWFLVFRWFPGELFFIDGGWQGMRIIAAVDLVLGPALTLIFYKVGKPNLKFDLSVIAAVQICALTYGVWSAYQQSTVALAFVEGRFVTVSASALTEGNKEMLEAGRRIQSLDRFSEHRPAQIYVDPPSQDTQKAYYDEILNGMPELQERTQRFLALKDNYEKISTRQLTSDSFGEHEELLKKKYLAYFNKDHIHSKNYHAFRLKARYGNGLVIFNSLEKKITDIIR